MSLDAKAPNDRGFFLFNGVVSVVALGLLTWLLLFRSATDNGVDLSFMPAVNAGFNASAALCLLTGWVAIRTGRRALHQRLMVAAFASSALFFVGYLAYHYVHGDTRYEGPMRGLYLVILGTHVLLSLPVVPMALSAFYFAWKERFETHRKITRILAPIWLYVSVTGVVVFFFLHA